METRLELNNFLVSQQETFIKITGVGKNEILILDLTKIKYEIYDWSLRKNANDFISKKAKGSYTTDQVGKLKKEDEKTVVLSGVLNGNGCEQGKTLLYKIKILATNHSLQLTVSIDDKIALNAGDLFIKQKDTTHLNGCAKYKSAKRFCIVFQKIEDECFFGFDEESLEMNRTCVSNKKRGFIVDAKNNSYITTSKKNNELDVFIWDNTCTIWVSFDTSVAKVVEKQSQILGLPSQLPTWALGTIIGLKGGKLAVEKELQNFEKENTSINAICLHDWQGCRGSELEKGLWWHWSPDAQLYPDFKNWITGLNERGMQVLGYVNPFISVDPDCPIYCEAHEKGYFLKHEDGSDYVCHNLGEPNYTYCHIDLSNSAAYEWLKKLMSQNLIANGFSGWLADYGEYPPLDAVCKSENSIKYHWGFPTLWAKLNNEVIENANRDCQQIQKKYCVMHRQSDFELSKTISSYWISLQGAYRNEYEKIANAITQILNAGMRGMLINHTSIGGICSINSVNGKQKRNIEDLYRWCEFLCFSPAYRTSDSASLLAEKYDTDSSKKYKIFSYFAQVHNKLSEYLLLTEQDAIKLGLPMMRALFMQFPNDIQSWNIKTQYMLGDSLLVAPVVKRHTKELKVWLPAGKWQHIWSKQRFSSTGQYIQINAELGHPSVFINLNGQSAKMLCSLF